MSPMSVAIVFVLSVGLVSSLSPCKQAALAHQVKVDARCLTVLERSNAVFSSLPTAYSSAHRGEWLKTTRCSSYMYRRR